MQKKYNFLVFIGLITTASKSAAFSATIMNTIKTLGTVTEPFKLHLPGSLTFSGGDLSYGLLYLIKHQSVRNIPLIQSVLQKNSIVESLDTLNLFTQLYFHYPQKIKPYQWALLAAVVGAPLLKNSAQIHLTDLLSKLCTAEKAAFISPFLLNSALYLAQTATLASLFYTRDIKIETFIKSAAIGLIIGQAGYAVTKNTTSFSLPLYITAGILHNRIRCFSLSTPQTSNFTDLH